VAVSSKKGYGLKRAVLQMVMAIVILDLNPHPEGLMVQIE
jgi:hypothetical protein